MHTLLSRCKPAACRSLNFCYIAARYLSGLDFVSAADHVSNGRSDLGKWREQRAAWKLFDEPGEFVVLPAYEASFKGGAGGDNNVYMLREPDIFIEDYEEGTVKTMCEKLLEVLDRREFFVVPHHTTRTGKHGEIPEDIYPGADLMPVVEIHSKWGTSEYRGNPNPLKKIHPGPSYVVDLLSRGLKLGFIGGTDTHSTMPAGFGDDHLTRIPGMTAVWAPQLTREDVYCAIRNCNCYAASLERIYLDVSTCGRRPGKTIESCDPREPRAIAVTAAGKSDIVSVEIVRNGETIHRTSPGSWNTSFEFTDGADLSAAALESRHLGRFVYYYVRVTCSSGAQAWSSPVWLIM